MNFLIMAATVGISIFSGAALYLSPASSYLASPLLGGIIKDSPNKDKRGIPYLIS